jgi:dinuclear metal center YbgI/SA1388 family protein
MSGSWAPVSTKRASAVATFGEPMRRQKLVAYLDEYLAIDAIDDRSVNGLQVEGRGTVTRLALAVDASLKTIQGAAKLDADMLIVHHGLFWRRDELLTGIMHKRVAALIRAGISLYAAHLPLDCHAEVGNNAELVRLLGLKRGKPFGRYHGVDIGLTAEPGETLTRYRLARRVSKVLKTKPHVLGFGPERIRQVAVISGSAAELAGQAADAGCDTFITGETSHIAYHLAKEAGINLICAGHYASETVGVRALGRHLRQQFDVDCRFVSNPTGY